MKEYLLSDLSALAKTIYTTNDSEMPKMFDKVLKILIQALKGGNKILVCGNGGSASDAEHMAGELVGRFGYDRPSLPCLALTGPTATMTAIANDYGYKLVFKRQVESLGNENDVLIAISTSGNSPNVVEAVKAANEKNLVTVAMTGHADSQLSQIANYTLRAPSYKTPRIQEIHGILIHSLCRGIEDEIFGKSELPPSLPSDKIISPDKIAEFAEALKGYESVFTNGCFDILHPGHVYLLKECRKYGELLIVGLNSDDSIKRLKGSNRPYHNFKDRAAVLEALTAVDYIIEFNEDTPENLIKTLTPKVLIKGGDYTKETVVGSDWVEKHGGETVIIPLLEGHSTTAILKDKNKGN